MTTESTSRTPLFAGIAAAVLAGYITIGLVVQHVSPRMLPWVLGRGLGIGAYLIVTVLIMTGLWLRHPWRVRYPRPTAASLHHAHALLASVGLVLLVGHIVALAVDRFAGVGWSGAFIPGAAGYRPFAVALGTISVYLGVAVGATAAFAGWVGRRVWLPIHRLAAAIFGLAWAHGMLAGSDAKALQPMYLITGVALVGLAASRRLAGVPRSMIANDAS